MITPTTPFHADSLYPNGEPTPAQGRPPLAHRRRDDAVPLELLCVRPIRWTVLLVAALVVTPSVPLQSRAAPLRPGRRGGRGHARGQERVGLRHLSQRLRPHHRNVSPPPRGFLFQVSAAHR